MKLVPNGESARAVIDLESRTLELAFASEAPVDMWYGTEILSMEPGAMRTGVRQQTMPMLFNHDMNDLLGVVEQIRVDRDRMARAIVRFGKDERGEWAMSQAADNVLVNVSFMYRVFKWIEDTEAQTLTAVDWEPLEISLVTVPKDATVGAGRSEDIDVANAVEVLRSQAAAQPPADEAEPMAAVAVPEARNAALEIRSTRGAAPAQPGAAQSTESPTTTDEETMKVKLRRTPVANAAETVISTAGGAAGTPAGEADPIKAERARVDAIVALGRKHDLSMEKVHDMIRRGLDIAAARGEVLDGILERSQRPVADFGENFSPDLSDKDKRSYSFLRLMQALVSNDWSKAGFEQEVSRSIAKKMGKEGGFFLPNDLPFAPDEKHARAWQMLSHQGVVQQRAPYLVGTAAQGGNLVQTQLLYENFIEVLRNQLVTAVLGARYLTGLVGNIDIPRQNSQTATAWVGESGAASEAEATFDKVSLRPKTITALSKMSRLMLLQSTPAIEMLARQDLLAVIALAMDLAAMSGSGAGGQPVGIVNTAGVNSVIGGTNGANLTFDHLIQLKYATRFANAPQGAAAFAMNSKAVGYLSTLKASTGQYLWDPQGGLTAGSPDRVKGSPYAESQQLRSALTKGTSAGICSELIYGNWQELFIGMWGVTELMLNPYDSTGFQNGDVLIRAMQTCDIGVRHGASFAVMSDALTPGF